MNTTKRKSAFTLVELLVVIGIIALLISILLPSLQSARRSANTVKCSSNIRSILQGMQLYAAENNGFFPGGPNTSARFSYVDPQATPISVGSDANGEYGDDNYPNLVGMFDYISPIASVLGIEFNRGATVADRSERFQQLRDVSIFNCPENEFLAVPFGGGAADFEVGALVSYNTSMVFHLKHNDTGGNSGGNGVGRSKSRTDWNVPQGYSPQIARIGGASDKMYLADGARYSRSTIEPDFSTSPYSSYGGAFSDQGAPFRFSNAWDRENAPGSGGGDDGVDARVYAYRHGGDPGDRVMKANFGFFDGHVETLGDLEGADPNMWVPEGTSLNVAGNQMWQDVIDTYYDGVEGVYIAK
ncbi:MAG: prepilin-type N-terminal cleavage/methylation domain-containing protein [Planctomycetota bacterium]